MDTRTPSPRTLAVLAALAVLLGAAPRAAAAVRVHSPQEVAAIWITARDGVPVLTHGDLRWELVTDPADPELSSLGDGAFHPMDVREVERALEGIGELRSLGIRILVLPYPRRGALRSSCENGVVFLSPGIRPVDPAHVHATVVHEVGHLVQQAWAREGSSAWSEYLALRGLDVALDPSTVEHRRRPREIFAEDFRLLRGGPEAVAAGGHENADLAPPDRVPGLPDWFQSLTLRIPLPVVERVEPAVSPNPYRRSMGPAIEIRFATSEAPVATAHADVYDLSGRRVAVLDGRSSGPRQVSFHWNGRDRRGRAAAPGVYFVRWRDRPDRDAARVHILH